MFVTLRLNRKEMPKDLPKKKKKTEKGRNISILERKSLCYDWKDKKDIVLSTIHNTEMIELERNKPKKFQ